MYPRSGDRFEFYGKVYLTRSSDHGEPYFKGVSNEERIERIRKRVHRSRFGKFCLSCDTTVFFATVEFSVGEYVRVGTAFYNIDNEAMDWLVESGVRFTPTLYVFGREGYTGQTVFRFKNEEDMLLFKLRWL